MPNRNFELNILLKNIQINNVSSKPNISIDTARNCQSKHFHKIRLIFSLKHKTTTISIGQNSISNHLISYAIKFVLEYFFTTGRNSNSFERLTKKS